MTLDPASAVGPCEAHSMPTWIVKGDKIGNGRAVNVDMVAFLDSFPSSRK